MFNRLNYKIKIIVYAVVVGWLAPQHSLALEAGEPFLNSQLGSPLQMVIPLRVNQPSEATALQVSLANRADYERRHLGYPESISQLHIDVEQTSEGVYAVKLGTDRAVVNPNLHLLLRFDWQGGGFFRQYSVLLDPPELTAQSQSKADAWMLKKPQSASQNQAQTEAEDKTSAYGPVTAGETLSSVVNKLLPPGVSRHQGWIAFYRKNPDSFYLGNINYLIKDSILLIPSKDEMLSTDPEIAYHQAFALEQGIASLPTDESAPSVSDEPPVPAASVPNFILAQTPTIVALYQSIAEPNEDNGNNASAVDRTSEVTSTETSSEPVNQGMEEIGGELLGLNPFAPIILAEPRLELTTENAGAEPVVDQAAEGQGTEVPEVDSAAITSDEAVNPSSEEVGVPLSVAGEGEFQADTELVAPSLTDIGTELRAIRQQLGEVTAANEPLSLRLTRLEIQVEAIGEMLRASGIEDFVKKSDQATLFVPEPLAKDTSATGVVGSTQLLASNNDVNEPSQVVATAGPQSSGITAEASDVPLLAPVGRLIDDARAEAGQLERGQNIAVSSSQTPLTLAGDLDEDRNARSGHMLASSKPSESREISWADKALSLLSEQQAFIRQWSLWALPILFAWLGLSIFRRKRAKDKETSSIASREDDSHRELEGDDLFRSDDRFKQELEQMPASEALSDDIFTDTGPGGIGNDTQAAKGFGTSGNGRSIELRNTLANNDSNQAIRGLKDAHRQQPERDDIAFKLLQLYQQQGDRPAFDELSAALLKKNKATGLTSGITAASITALADRFVAKIGTDAAQDLTDKEPYDIKLFDTDETHPESTGSEDNDPVFDSAFDEVLSPRSILGAEEADQDSDPATGAVGKPSMGDDTDGFEAAYPVEINQHEPVTALALARAYIELGEIEIAKDFLSDVLRDGTGEVLQEAKSLLATL